MTEEPRYTLGEAQQKLAEDQCSAEGHNFEILKTFGHDEPTNIFCTRCGRSWRVID